VECMPLLFMRELSIFLFGVRSPFLFEVEIAQVVAESLISIHIKHCIL
jgi:hypothetical protein